jgi:hypothetical protein
MIGGLGWVSGALAHLSFLGWGEMRRRGLGYALARGESRGR